MNGDLQFRAVPAGSGDAADLVGAMVAEMRELYDGLDLEAPDMPKAGPAELGPPDGVYLVGYRDGIPVCGGGLKQLTDGACEIKRMYVDPSRRGRRLGAQLLDAAEARLRRDGYRWALLETGRDQTEALKRYHGAGYTPCAPFGGYPDNGLSLFLGKAL